MATAMLTERSLRRKIVAEEKKTAAAAAAAAAAALADSSSTITSPPVTTRKATKRKSTAKASKAPVPTSTTTPTATEQNNNVKRLRLSPQDTQDEMLSVYQPWVIQTYGDLAKTKTITLKKYARILRTLRGEEMISADNSKFRFWVKAKGFHMGAPSGYDAKPADGIVGRHSVCDMDGGIPPLDEKLLGSAKDPPLYVPNAPFKNSTSEPVYRKVAIVENFFDIIYNVHVELEGRPGKHAGQKRTYRTITETYAFLPREAVTRFLLGCTDCQKHPRSPSPLTSVLPTPSPSPTLPPCSETAATVVAAASTDQNPSYNNNNIISNNNNNSVAIGATAGHHDDMAIPFANGSNTSATTAVSTPKRSHSQHEDEDAALSKPTSPCQQICVEATATPDASLASETSVTSRRSNNPLDVCNLTARDPPKNLRKRRKINHTSEQVAVSGLVAAGSANASGQDPSYASANISSNCSSSSSSGSRNCSRPNSPLGLTTPRTPPPHAVVQGATSVTVSPLALPPMVPTHTYTTSTVTVTTTTGAAAPPNGNAGQQGAITVSTSSPGGALSVGVTTPTVNGILHSTNNSSTSTPPTPKLWSPVASIEREQQQRLLQQQQQQQQQQQRHKSHPLQHQYLYSSMDLHLQQQFLQPQQQYTLPITTTYLKYMRSLGCSDEDAMQLDTHNENLIQANTPESTDNNDEDHFTGSGAMKENDKLKLMLLAWNYHNQTQGNRNGGEIPDLSSMPGGEEMAGLWAQYHSALGLAKGGKATPPGPMRDQSSPVNAETGSAHDETSSSGNKEDEDDDDDESDDKIDTHTRDPERLKAFNMFVRLFVDENLDRMVPISKQPKEKIQAIIDSCTRQFPEFAERARKRIRTYLKSCRRNKRARDPNSSWDATRPTPAHLTSVQAEQILATACENESHNAKRMRLGLEPVSQPMPLLPAGTTSVVDTTAPMNVTTAATMISSAPGAVQLSNRGLDYSGTPPVKMEGISTVTSGSDCISVTGTMSSVYPTAATSPAGTPNAAGVNKAQNLVGSMAGCGTDIKPGVTLSGGLSTNSMNGVGIASTTAGSAPTAMYRPNFSQAFQRAGPYPLFPGQSPFGVASSGLLTNGPADLSMKQKPLLNHKLNTGEMAAVRQLITGYRESAAFLMRSADELEHLLLQQQMRCYIFDLSPVLTKIIQHNIMIKEHLKVAHEMGNPGHPGGDIITSTSKHSVIVEPSHHYGQLQINHWLFRTCYSVIVLLQLFCGFN